MSYFSLYKVSPFTDQNLQIGQYIASNGGVVTAEELAPYLDLPITTGVMVRLYINVNLI